MLEILPLLGELYHFLKFSQNTFRKCISPNISIEKLMLSSESAPQELSNEWSCQ
jgi:hypothetical protein